ncbi:membrane protein YfhO [Chitinophaga skermanii]|uniref:Membrane protein YfhO n=1 Tax=Chitinophaga skermanii TaxID=331697 RepID=A0A327QY90_9BACT|nr:YfhO family protein [Chitinophaga skermanii]RAJ08393.1 membrane protein YfhO [Chitinophaga skermanii]
MLNWQKNILPHVYAILIFVGVSFLICSPVLEGLELKQSDNIEWRAGSQEAREYKEKTGINPLWTNSMFGGMPTYQLFMDGTNYVYWVHLGLSLGLPKPVNILFLAMLGFYFLLAVMRFRHWINIAGAISFGLSTASIILIATGHDSKVICLVYVAPVIAGLILTYRGKYLIGGVVTCLMLALLITNNHYQILYYTLLMAGALGVSELVLAYKRKTFKNFFIATAILIVAAVAAVLPSTVNLWTTSEYAKYTMRGGQSELTLNQDAANAANPGAPAAAPKSKGLDRDYAFAWSQDFMETFTFLIPNLYGGSNHENIGENSKTAKTLSEIGVQPQQVNSIVSQFPLYWGPLPFTEGPVYIGAAIIFLFVLSLFVIKSPHKWWMITMIIIGVLMAMGKHFPLLNNFLFDYLPMYNKFRAPTQSLMIPQILMPVMACWALNEVVTEKIATPVITKQLKMALYISGGLCLAFILASYMGFFSYLAENDGMKQSYEQNFGANPDVFRRAMSALADDRASALRSDAFRSLFIILVAAGLIWAFIKKQIKNANVLVGLIALVVLIDLFIVDKRYLNSKNFVTPSEYASIFHPRPVDEAIMRDTDPYYRVLDVSNSPFQDALPSYYHKSIGGYHAAKLSIYQDLIEHQLSKNNMQTLNMLNTKYIIVPGQQGLSYQQNPDALGNAWFVNKVNIVPNANAEMTTLNTMNPKDTAVIDQRMAASLNGYTYGKDSSSQIKLTSYGLNELKYTSSNTQNGFAVFSDIYYPAGWKLLIDGQEAEILRVNYALRGAKIPAGKHELVMKFEPRSYMLGNKISQYSSLLILLLLVVGLVLEALKSKKASLANN